MTEEIKTKIWSLAFEVTETHQINRADFFDCLDEYFESIDELHED
jgi:hypothetical protein